ncbi:MAG TPA: hypothetical protein VKI62_04625, partial [Bacteroidota bacterium]|nr:hypothetical protein [Bacteroidota bacterium]
MTAGVDGMLAAEMLSQFHQHISECPRCRFEYEFEIATKSVVRNRLRRVAAPPELRNEISLAIAREQTSPSFYQMIGDFLIRPSRQMMIAFGTGLAIIAVLFFYTPKRIHHTHTQPVDGNMIHQTYNDFDSVLDGKLVPQIASSDPTVVGTFLEPAVNFHVSFMPMNRCALVGGHSTHYCKHHLAHLFYHLDDNVVYILQTRYSDVLQGGDLNLPENVLQQLKATGRYYENPKPDCSLVIWVKDSLICCAISDIPREQLLTS